MASIKSHDSNYTSGSSAVTGQPAQGQRRRHNFGDRMYKLSPEETPFFAYLSAVGKAPTDDPVFRVLEDRAPMKWADRSFTIAQPSSAGGDKVILDKDTEQNWTVDGASASATSDLPVGSAAAELVPGMLVQALSWDDENAHQITGRITEVDVVASTVQIQTVYSSLSADEEKTGAAGMDVQVIGSAFAEGSGAPESFGYDMDDTYGYTQIFKTSADMSNTARATVLRGYASEWDRIWSLKLREHKVDIERAFLFNNKGRDATNGIQYTDGIIGKIITQGGAASLNGPSDDAVALSYTANQPFIRNVDTGANEVDYDRFLDDFEVIFAPERGGASEKFCMASMAVVTYLNRLKSGYMTDSLDSNIHSYNLDFSSLDGGLGHKVMRIDTVHGSISVVKNPLLKGIGKSMMVGVDLGCVSYRPLVGNGLNRDTYIETNVQPPDYDSRKDQILTEAGLEVCLPEAHFLYNFVSGSTPIG